MESHVDSLWDRYLAMIRDGQSITQSELYDIEEDYLALYNSITEGEYYTGNNDDEMTDSINRLDILYYTALSALNE